jgi:hypothetical protein
VVTSGLAKTDSDLEQASADSRLRLVARPMQRASTSVRIHLSDDLFRSSNPIPTAHRGTEIPNCELENPARGVIRPIALAAMTGLLLGFLVGRYRK